MSSVQEADASPDPELCFVAPEQSFLPSLLDYAAENDLSSFIEAVEAGARVDEPLDWYGRIIGANRMSTEPRTAMMIASLYGSVEVLEYVLTHLPSVNSLNKAFGIYKVTALHCAAAGGSVRAVETIKLLLARGACANIVDALGRKPVDVLVVSPMILDRKVVLEDLLNAWKIDAHDSIEYPLHDRVETRKGALKPCLDFPASDLSVLQTKCLDDLSSETADKSFNSLSTFLSVSSPDSSPLFSPPFPSSPKSSEDHYFNSSGEGTGVTKEYASDPSLPDIKNTLYTTDEFRMFSFKVRPCSRAYSHDWTECPFVHPGENARRRDPRRYHYSCVPCPDFRKGSCRRGDACEYAHGVFECWLHPAQYRTRLCKDGTNCARRVCFFAHTPEELRPLYLSMVSAVPSPRASSPSDAKCLSPTFPSASPLQTRLAPQYSSSNLSANPPQLSLASSLHPASGSGWPQSNIPPLLSRLKESLNARDIALEDLDDCLNLESSLVSGVSSWSRPTSTAVSAIGKIGKHGNIGLSIPPPNFQDMFAPEPSTSSINAMKERSPFSAKVQGQLQSHIDSILSPKISQKLQSTETTSPIQQSFARFSISNSESLKPISTRKDGSDLLHSTFSLSPDAAAGLSSRKAAFALRGRESLSSKDLLGSVSSATWSDWGSPSGKPDWGVQGHELSKFKKSASFASHGPREPDISLVQALMKNGPGDAEVCALNTSGAAEGTTRSIREMVEHSLCYQIPQDKMAVQ